MDATACNYDENTIQEMVLWQHGLCDNRILKL